MSMILALGNYQFSPSTVNLSNIDRNTKYSQLMQPEAVIETWTCEGRLYGSNPTDVSQKMADLTAATSQPAVDAVLYMPDGVTPSAHALRINQTLDGQLRIKVLPSYPGKPGDYTTFRNFKLVIEAELPLTTDFIYHDFTEKLTFTGGNPRFRYLEQAVGPPQRQLCRQQTIYKVTQEGKAVGYLEYPPIPDPLWPAYELEDERVFVVVTPRKVGQGYEQYEWSWTYFYESDVPLSGYPNVV